MPLAIRCGERSFRSDHLSINELELLDERTLSPGALLKFLSRVGIDDPRDIRFADLSLEVIDDDLPTEFADGIPVTGGSHFDFYLVAFSKPPWCWPPDVTRRQRLRDLDLLLDAMEDA